MQRSLEPMRLQTIDSGKGENRCVIRGMDSRDGPAFDCLYPEWCKAYLQHDIIPLQELDEAWHDTAFDDLFNWWVFLLGKQLPEFCRSI